MSKARTEIAAQLSVGRPSLGHTSSRMKLSSNFLVAFCCQPALGWWGSGSSCSVGGALDNSSQGGIQRRHVKPCIRQTLHTSPHREKRWRRPLLEMADHNVCDGKVALLHRPETLAQSAANLERCALVSPVLLTRVPMLQEPVMQRESRPSQEFGANTLWPHSLNQKFALVEARIKKRSQPAWGFS